MEGNIEGKDGWRSGRREWESSGCVLTDALVGYCLYWNNHVNINS